MAPALRPSEVWKSIPWKKYQRNVFRLQEARPTYGWDSIKPNYGAMSGLSTIYSGCCFAPGQHGF